MTSDEFLKIVSHGLFDFLESEDGISDLSSRKENDWSQALARFFQTAGYFPAIRTECDHAYLGNGERFDLLLTLPGSLSLYLEVKGIWKSYWCDRSNLSKHESYLFSPFKSRKSARSAAMDLEKLARILPKVPGDVLASQLIIGSARPNHSLGVDLDLYESLTKTNESPWSKAQRSWQNHSFPDFDYDARMYVCDKRGLQNWWSQHGSYW